MNNSRHNAILKIIKEVPVTTQEELQKYLLDMGFNVTQSTVSRDIKQLRIIKTVDANGNNRYADSSDNAYKSSASPQVYMESFRHACLKVDYALNNVVVKCLPGMASSACVAIDALFSDHLLGSLAGDDTIIIVTKNETESEYLVNKLRALKG